MDQGVLVQFKDLGGAAVLGLSAIGSALGIGAAGMAAVGAWKKCYAQNKAAPFLLIVFIGAPLSQTIYGYILMGAIIKAATQELMWSIGILGGAAIGLSAFFEERSGPAARMPWLKRKRLYQLPHCLGSYRNGGVVRDGVLADERRCFCRLEK